MNQEDKNVLAEEIKKNVVNKPSDNSDEIDYDALYESDLLRRKSEEF